MNKLAYYRGYTLSKQADLPNTWDLHSRVLGDDLKGTAANIGTYLIPFYGDARMGLDTLSSFGNMFGKNKTLKQRIGHGVSGALEGLFAAGGLGAGIAGAGVGSTAVTAAGKPIVGATKALFGLNKLKKAHKAYKALKAKKVKLFDSLAKAKKSAKGWL